MKEPSLENRRGCSPSGRPSTWLGRAALALWVAALGLWIQFAVASGEELEPQAAALGWITVIILLAGGLAVWAARLQTRNRRR